MFEKNWKERERKREREGEKSRIKKQRNSSIISLISHLGGANCPLRNSMLSRSLSLFLSLFFFFFFFVFVFWFCGWNFSLVISLIGLSLSFLFFFCSCCWISFLFFQQFFGGFFFTNFMFRNSFFLIVILCFEKMSSLSRVFPLSPPFSFSSSFILWWFKSEFDIFFFLFPLAPFAFFCCCSFQFSLKNWIIDDYFDWTLFWIYQSNPIFACSFAGINRCSLGIV